MRVTGTQAPNHKEEAALIARLRDGDETAMADLYDRYSGVVYGVALRVLGDTAAAEDLLQEVFDPKNCGCDHDHDGSRRGRAGSGAGRIRKFRSLPESGLRS